MSHGPHKSHNIPQEIIVARVFWLVIIVYFGLELFLGLTKYNLLSHRLIEAGGMTLLWETVTAVWMTWLKPVFIVLDILCVIIAVYSAIKVWPKAGKISVFKKPGGHGHDANGPAHGGTAAATGAPQHNPAVIKHWTDIVKRANTGSPENLRWAIMESDALVDLVIKEKGLPGDTMADRLANFRREEYKTIDKMWDAHRLRNEIAHTPGFKISTRQAEKALFAYRDFLKELKAF